MDGALLLSSESALHMRACSVQARVVPMRGEVTLVTALSVLELKMSTSNAAGQSPASGPPSHAVTFHYRRVIPIKLTAKSVK